MNNSKSGNAVVVPSSRGQCLKPTHFEEDGTYWLVNNGIWYYWRELWGWCGYIGQVNTAFLASKQQISQMYE